MSLSSLKFSAQTRPLRAWQMSPEQRRRERVLNGLTIQRAIAQAEKLGKTADFKKTVRGISEAGAPVERIVHLRPRRWFWRGDNGALLMQVLYSGEPVPLSKEGATVECVDLDALLAAMDVIESATRLGELDSALSKTANAKKQRVQKAA